MADIQILLDNQDIYTNGRIEFLPVIVQEKGKFDNIPVINDFSIKIRNDDNQFSRFNNGFFQGKSLKELREIDVKIYVDNILLYNGMIKNFPTRTYGTEKTVDLVITSKLYKAFAEDIIVSWLTSDTEPGKTPAQLFEDILTYYGFAQFIDLASLNRAKAYQENNSILCRLNIYSKAQILLFDVLSKLAIAGNARLYSYNNKLYYQIYEPDYLEASAYNITKNDIGESLTITPEDEGETFEDYQITTIAGVATRNTLETKNLFNHDFSNSQYLKMLSLTGGISLGENIIEDTSRDLEIISFRVPFDFGFNLFNLYDFFNFSYSDEGYDSVYCEVIKKTINQQNNSIDVEAKAYV